MVFHIWWQFHWCRDFFIVKFCIVLDFEDTQTKCRTKIPQNSLAVCCKNKSFIINLLHLKRYTGLSMKERMVLWEEH